MTQEENASKNQTLSGDEKLDKKINDWLEWDQNPKTKSEINELVVKKDWATYVKYELDINNLLKIFLFYYTALNCGFVNGYVLALPGCVLKCERASIR